VVHINHGIGRYQGLINIDLGEGPSEFLHLEYADKATLYVPVAQLHLISRYTGVSADEAPLHKLGSAQWDKARRKAAEQVRDTAAELLNLYARRAAREGICAPLQPARLRSLCGQLRLRGNGRPARRHPRGDPGHDQPAPMDRLVCGDVGFGKTEVALRAAFVAVHGGKQVAILAPTTLLAEQHYQTPGRPLWQVAGEDCRAVALSQRQGSEAGARRHGRRQRGHRRRHAQAAVSRRQVQAPGPAGHRRGTPLRRAPQGSDEGLRAEVDVLTLTATPIPRTLGMALEGLRDLSVIATAPQRRLAIKTFVRAEGNSVIREAVLRELKRGGQVYFLHNEVETIENRRRSWWSCCPRRASPWPTARCPSASWNT
jgi:transcription-repair coupling factor (superfamily II helicase)